MLLRQMESALEFGKSLVPLGSRSSRGEGQTAVGLRSEWEVSKC